MTNDHLDLMVQLSLQCCALGLVRSTHKNHLFRVRKKILFRLKLPGSAATKQAGLIIMSYDK